MLTPNDMFGYQREATLHGLSHPDSMLWLGTGLGKTACALTNVVDRQRADQVRGTIILGPLRVVQSVWRQEARKWSHLQHLRFSLIHGDKMRRRRAMFARADIHLLNYENLSWFAGELDHYFTSRGDPLPWNMVIYDEVTKLKNSTSVRMNGGKRDITDPRTGAETTVTKIGWRKFIDKFDYRMGLTGTPASNGYLDLHGQYLAVDGGKRLGPYKTAYRENYFSQDWNGWGHQVTDVGRQQIESRIHDITLKMDTKDYRNDIPDSVTSDITVTLPPKAMKIYKDMEKDMFAELDEGKDVEVFNGAAAAMKCLQIANSAIYTQDRLPDDAEHTATALSRKEWVKVHDAKLDALEDILEEAGGNPVLVAYAFKSDAARIMERFKHLRPVNLTAEPASRTDTVIERWKQGGIRLMIGHPACLHPGTKVLTEWRGWVRLVDVKARERVFDGVEFVSHGGCSYSGHKEVTDVFGITMTPDHKLLVSGIWEEAGHVRNCPNLKRKALYEYQGDDCYLSKMLTLRKSVEGASPECHKTQQEGQQVLPALRSGQVPFHDQHSYMENLAGDETESRRRYGCQLRRTRDQCLYGVDEFRDLLRGHGRRLCGRPDYRTQGCEPALLERQLLLGVDVCPAGKQAYDPLGDIPRGSNPPCGTVPSNGTRQDDASYETQQRNDSRRSGGRCATIALRKKRQPEKRKKATKAHVYDLVNCGPRHRFLIKNEQGEVFVSHNSMGHGLDGLQDAGNILVWFGLPYSLELYDQMIARLDRTGQKRPVSILRILAENTLDIAVAGALKAKATDEASLKSAIAAYRCGADPNISFA